MLTSNKTIFKLTTNKLYTKYYNHDTFFDIVIKETDLPIFDISLDQTAIPFGCTLYNNPFKYIENKKYGTDNIIFCHRNNWIKNIKKEDQVLMVSQLSQNYKITFNPKIFSIFQKDGVTNYIKYGVPAPTIKSNKDKDILVINTNKSSTMSLVYEQLKNIFPNVDLLQETNISYSQLCNQLYPYRIVVSEGIDINEIVANICGCYVISTGDAYEGSIGSFNNEDMDSLISQLQEKINSYSEISNENIANLLNIYNYNQFALNLNIFFKNLTQKI